MTFLTSDWFSQRRSSACFISWTECARRMRILMAASYSADSESIWRGSENTRRSEEHTSELQSRLHLVCRLLLEKKKSLIESKEVLKHTDYTVARLITTHLL